MKKFFVCNSKSYFLFELHGYPYDKYEGLWNYCKELFYHVNLFKVIKHSLTKFFDIGRHSPYTHKSSIKYCHICMRAERLRKIKWMLLYKVFELIIKLLF